MRLTPDFERTLRRYVLGDLEEDVRPELEELLVTDFDAFEALGVIEDELIGEYVEETGSATERRRFERNFLTSAERLRRLSLARALKRRASATPRPRAETHDTGFAPVRPFSWRPAWVGLAAALAVSLVGNVWQAAHYWALGARVEGPSPHRLSASTSPAPVGEISVESEELRARLAREQRERAEADARVKTLEKHLQGSRAPVVTFTLAAGLLRSGGSLPRVSLPSGAVVVRLRLELPGEDYPRYRAALLDADGDEIWTASKLAAEAEAGRTAVVLVLPAGLLPRGDYQVKLSGVAERGNPEAVATYSLRVSPP